MNKRTGQPLTTNLFRTDLARSQATKGIADAHEASVAEALGGRRTSGSGNKDFDKGDVKAVHVGSFELLIECKATQARSIKLMADWLVKITEEAGLGRVPALSIKFQPTALEDASRIRFRGRVISTEEEWVMVPLSVFKRMAGEDE